MPPWSPGSIFHRGTERGRPRRRTLGRGRPLPRLPAWVPIAGTGPDGLGRKTIRTCGPGPDRAADTARRRSGGHAGADRETASPRLEPLEKALGATPEGLPTARRLIVLPSSAMAGIPVEALLAPDDTRTVSYAPSATVFKYLREQPRTDRQAGLLAVGDPLFFFFFFFFFFTSIRKYSNTYKI